MDLTKGMLQLAVAIDGRFVEYSNDTTILLVPVEEDGCQAVVSQVVNKNGQHLYEFSSKAGELTPGKESHQVILKLNQELFYSKVIIQDWHLKVAAETLASSCTEQLIRDVVIEVATVAYHLEHDEIATPLATIKA